MPESVNPPLTQLRLFGDQAAVATYEDRTPGLTTRGAIV